MRFSIQQNTVQGKRHENQDRMGYIFTREALLLMVCDGLGGHGNGELAASWALQTLAQRFQHFAKPKLDDPQAFLEASIISAHARILKMTLTSELSTHPRTTVVCALIQDGQVWFAHAGDSRGYLIRFGKTLARTKDHSKLQYLLDTGKIKPEQATADHPDRNRLINCLGAEVFPAVEQTGPFALIENDTVLLCSDGVWGVLTDETLLEIISQSDLAKTLPGLVHRASIDGGAYADDATGMALRWLAEEPVKKEPLKGSVNSAAIVNDFESTVHLTITQDTDIRVMTDDEMDAQIAEINQALDKFKARQT
jgi:serine/threonine protein phosphatase PrpC